MRKVIRTIAPTLALAASLTGAPLLTIDGLNALPDHGVGQKLYAFPGIVCRIHTGLSLQKPSKGAMPVPTGPWLT